jgi:hypothetical protein
MGEPKTVRERMIEEQDDHNRRMRKLTRSQRERVSTQAKAVFRCNPCGRDVCISWKALNREGGTPKCRDCGGPLQLVTACLNTGVLPKAR